MTLEGSSLYFVVSDRSELSRQCGAGLGKGIHADQGIRIETRNRPRHRQPTDIFVLIM